MLVRIPASSPWNGELGLRASRTMSGSASVTDSTTHSFPGALRMVLSCVKGPQPTSSTCRHTCDEQVEVGGTLRVEETAGHTAFRRCWGHLGRSGSTVATGACAGTGVPIGGRRETLAVGRAGRRTAHAHYAYTLRMHTCPSFRGRSRNPWKVASAAAAWSSLDCCRPPQ